MALKIVMSSVYCYFNVIITLKSTRVVVFMIATMSMSLFMLQAFFI